VEIRGPVVRELVTLFRAHWKEQGGEALAAVQPSPEPAVEGMEIIRILGSRPTRLTSRYYVTVLSAIRTAERSIWITAAYFVPTHQELSELKAAARRRVDVRLVLPSQSDWAPVVAIQRSHYAGLIRAGVKVYERDDGILHSKSLVIDGVWSLVGSSNFDQRSILFNDEVDAIILGKSTAGELTGVFRSAMQHARRISLRDVHEFGLLERIRGRFWSLWEKLL
jgi:cardiolipin synthase A/B